MKEKKTIYCERLIFDEKHDKKKQPTLMVKLMRKILKI